MAAVCLFFAPRRQMPEAGSRKPEATWPEAGTALSVVRGAGEVEGQRWKVEDGRRPRLPCCHSPSELRAMESPPAQIRTHIITAQHSTPQGTTAQHSTPQRTTAQHSTAQHSTVQHSTAQHSTAQYSTAQHTRNTSSTVCRHVGALETFNRRDSVPTAPDFFCKAL